MPEWRIREARPEDCHQILHLIKVSVITLWISLYQLADLQDIFFKGGGGGEVE